MNKKRSLASLIQEYQGHELVNTIEKGFRKENVILMDVSKLRFNNISRKHFFNDKNLVQLSTSIKERGVLSPVLVRKKDDYYEVLSGYKRFYVASKLGLDKIPVVIREVNDDLLIYLVLSRATHKVHDNILNKTYSFEIINKEYGVSRKDIATLSKISISQVNNIIRLNKLSKNALNLLKKDKISYGQARVLVNLPDEKQNEYLHLIIENKLSVHDIENIAKRDKRPKTMVEGIESFEANNKVKLNIGRKTLTFKFKKISDLKKFMKNYFNDFN